MARNAKTAYALTDAEKRDLIQFLQRHEMILLGQINRYH